MTRKIFTCVVLIKLIAVFRHSTPPILFIIFYMNRINQIIVIIAFYKRLLIKKVKLWERKDMIQRIL